jgi:tail tube protein
MAIGAGLSGSVGIVNETTNGTAVTPTHFFEFNSESMKGDKNVVQGKGLRAAGNAFGSNTSLYMRTSRRQVGSWGAKGNIVFDAPYNSLGLLLEHMMGAYNPGATGGTNNPIVAQQASSAAYLQTYAPGSLAGKTFTMQIGKPGANGTVYPFTYVGCKVTDWQLDTEVNKYATFTVGIDAWQELTLDNPQGTTAGPALTSPTYTTGEQFFQFREATIFNSGTLSTTSGVTTLGTPAVAARVSKCSVKQANALEVERMFIAGTGGTGGSSVAGVKSEQLENEFRAVSGTLDVEFHTPSAYYDVWYGDTTANLLLTFTGPTAIASTYFPTLSILVPNIKYDGESPVVAGPGILNTSMPFTGLDDEASNTVQIQYMSTDTTP